MIILMLPLKAVSQTYIYKGNFKHPRNIMFNIMDGELREKNFSYGYPVLLTIRGNQIYNRDSMSLLDVIFTFKDGYLYYGYYADNPADILYSFDGEHIYFRDRQYALDIAYTIYMNGIYAGPTTFVSDVLYTIDGPYTVPELFAFMYALGLL